MKIFVAGASGATGRWLVAELLERGHQVVTVARPTSQLPERIADRKGLTVIKANLLDLSDDELTQIVAGCDAVASCLGHRPNFKGIYGKPRRLVTEATRRLSRAVQANQPDAPVKFVLMNTVANSNRDLNETRPLGERVIFGLLRLILPPQVDNEKAAEVLRAEIGQNDPMIEWVAVRPDTLIDAEQVSAYTLSPTLVSSALFGAEQASRINVGHFMAELITDDALWQQWQGQMPVIYNQASA